MIFIHIYSGSLYKHKKHPFTPTSTFGFCIFTLLLIFICFTQASSLAWAQINQKENAGSREAADYGQNRYSIYSGTTNMESFTFIAPEENNFTHNSDSTVLDRATALLWQKYDDNQQRNWQEALEYCQGLVLQDKQWRLPTRAELLSLVDFSATAPSINTEFFPTTKSFNYWASTPYTGTPQHAWSVLFSEGNAYCFLRVLDTYVRCVSTYDEST